MGKVMLEVRNLKTKYVTRFHEDVYAVDGVSFKIEEGKSLGIAGESGCGKSTLALSMMGYYFPPLHYMSGDIVIDGRNISGMKPDDVRKSILGTEIAYIPQAAMNALNPTQRIIRFIEDVVRAHDPKKDKKLIRELAEARFAELGLPPEVLDKHADRHRCVYHSEPQGSDCRRTFLRAGRDLSEDGYQDDAGVDGKGLYQVHAVHHPRAASALQCDR